MGGDLKVVSRHLLILSLITLFSGTPASFLDAIETRQPIKPSLSPKVTPSLKSTSPTVTYSNIRLTPSISRAVAILSPTYGNSTSGYVLFTRLANGNIRVQAFIDGLSPHSKHGFHIHEFGDLRASDGTTAGSHYNPDHHPHGLPPTPVRHAGSYGNLVADANGVARFDFEDTTISLDLKNPILGRAVVVHKNADDGSQPLGNAGPRIAVGVIGIANPTPNFNF
jgi:Cu-Zn family superoxide dismutase